MQSDAHGVDETSHERSGFGISRQGHGLSRGYGRTWALSAALSGLSIARAADPLCGERGELLPDLPNTRSALGRSSALAPAQSGLAEKSGRARRTLELVSLTQSSLPSSRRSD